MYHLLEKQIHIRKAAFFQAAHIFATQIRSIFVYFLGITYHSGMHTVGLCYWMLTSNKVKMDVTGTYHLFESV